MMPIFLDNSFKMSMMYLLKNIMLSSSFSSIFSFLKNRRQALVISPEKPPKSWTILEAKLRISVVRSWLHLNFYVRISWKRRPSWINNSPIYKIHIAHSNDFNNLSKGTYSVRKIGFMAKIRPIPSSILIFELLVKI
jgi:hypothetical protein